MLSGAGTGTSPCESSSKETTMPTPAPIREVVGGADTHKDTHFAAVITTSGQHLAAAQFPATTAGYEALIAFITSFGVLLRISVEGTKSYGASLT